MRLPVFLTLFLSLENQANQQFAFHQFENFVLNEETFKTEQILLNQLRDLKSKLLHFHKNIEARKRFPDIYHIYDVLKTLKSLQEIQNFPSENDLKGAFRGLILLQETYQLNPNSWLSGHLQFKNQSYPCTKLTPEDLKNLAFIAFEDKWYDNCITFLRAILPTLDDESLKLKQKVVEIHNKLVIQRKSRISEQDSKVFPYLVDENTLLKKSKQPKWVKKTQWFARSKDFKHGLKKEDAFRQICNRKLQDFSQAEKCYWLHHFDPFLKLCPFKLEELWTHPYRAKIYDFLSPREIDHFIEESKPHLSKARQSKILKEKREQNVRIIVKSVQHWTDDIIYRENVTYTYNEKGQGYQAYEMLPLQDSYSYDIKDELLFKISHRIQVATQTDVLSRFSSSRYQVIKYFSKADILEFLGLV